jgi:hypothetical protein
MGDLHMTNETHFFMVWTHRSADSVFGAAANPVIRNGAFLCFEEEEKARAECDRLNARRGNSRVHYSVKPARVRMSLPHEGTKGKAADQPFLLPALANSACRVSTRQRL